MFALALLLHLLVASPEGDAGGPDGNAPSGARGDATDAAPASAQGTGSGADALARPALTLPVSRAAVGPGPFPGPFGGRELVMAGVGALAGDALVLAAGYGTLQLFARDAIDPTATNFRRAAFVMLGASLVVPPVLAVLGARLVSRRHPGSAWKALLLACAANALALAAGYWSSPQIWAVVPAQLVGVTTATSVGLHWGTRHRERLDPPAPARPTPAPIAPIALLGACPVAG